MDKLFSIFNIELTNHCIMKCVMCPRTNNMTRGLGFMDFELYKKAIDELSSCNPSVCNNDILWLHHFGESLMHPEFGKFIAYAAGHNVLTGLSINPIMLKNEVIKELMTVNPHVIYVSLDGHDDESFYKIRGMKNAYHKSKDRLLDYIRTKAENKCCTRLILSMVDFNLNRDSIEHSRKYWESMPGIDQFLTKSFTTWDGSAYDINNLIDNNHNSRDRTSVQCSWPFERMTITWDGDVVPCCFDYNKKYVLGNFNSSTLSEIWNGEPIQRLRNEFMANKVKNPLCLNCRRLYMPKQLVEL